MDLIEDMPHVVVLDGGKKVIEEAGEVWMAAEYEGKEKTAEEINTSTTNPPAGPFTNSAGIKPAIRISE